MFSTFFRFPLSKLSIAAVVRWKTLILKLVTPHPTGYRCLVQIVENDTDACGYD